uniref:Uncharacterized protein n=1 Tax=Leersia perrieri TaxID=77586 RepID=A0A0D9VDQ5_9ORYZ
MLRVSNFKSVFQKQSYLRRRLIQRIGVEREFSETKTNDQKFHTLLMSNFKSEFQKRSYLSTVESEFSETQTKDQNGNIVITGCRGPEMMGEDNGSS